jgi:hypothetical protein
VCKPRKSEQLKTYIRDKTAGIVEEVHCSVMKNLTDSVQGCKASEEVYLLHSTATKFQRSLNIPIYTNNNADFFFHE